MPMPPKDRLRPFRFASDPAILQEGINVALNLRLVETVLCNDLRHEIILAPECGRILLGELVPLCPDFLQNRLFVLDDGFRFYSGRICHLNRSTNIDEITFERSSFRR